MTTNRKLAGIALALPLLLGLGAVAAAPAQAETWCNTAANGATACTDMGDNVGVGDGGVIDFDDLAGAVKQATAAKPSFSKSTGKYTIPAKTGVRYYVNGTAKSAGTYKGYSKYVTVTAKAASGYKLSGTAKWTYDFRTAVKPAKPGFDGKKNRYSIPKKAGVKYYVNGKYKKPGKYSTSNGRKLTFTAKASASTYRLTGTASWSCRF